MRRRRRRQEEDDLDERVSLNIADLRLKDDDVHDVDATATGEHSLQLEDLYRSTPSHLFESEAKAYILQAVEGHSAATQPTTSRTKPATVPHLKNSTECTERTVHDDSNKNDGASLRNNTRNARMCAMEQIREETVEEKLFDLTAAMDALHTLHDFPNQHPLLYASGGSNDSQHSWKTAVAGEEAISAGHAFQHNASILLHQQQHAVMEETPHSPETHGTSTEGSGRHESIWARGTMIKTSLLRAQRTHPATTTEGGPTQGGTDEEVAATSVLRFRDDNDDLGAAQTSERHHDDRLPTASPRVLHAKRRRFKRDLRNFFTPQKASRIRFLKAIVLHIALPAIGVASILFYLAGNPPTGILVNGGKPNQDGQLINEKGQVVSPTTASVSWWLLFLGVRQVLTYLLAKALNFLIIDLASVRTKLTVTLFGPWATLFILQCKGWPSDLFVWSVLDFALLSGYHPFFSHWGYWQDTIGLFNASNPSGGIVDSFWNHRVGYVAIALSVISALKRFWLGLYLGRQTYAQFSDQVAACMQKIVLISEVASLPLEMDAWPSQPSRRFRSTDSKCVLLGGLLDSAIADDDGPVESTDSIREPSAVNHIIDPEDRHPLTGVLSASQKQRITQLLGAWEEPRISNGVQEHVSVNAILQFQRALAFLDTDYPFSGSFGLAKTREDVVENSQHLYHRLKRDTASEKPLSFESLAVLGMLPNGGLDQPKLKELIRLFRPDRDGKLHLIHFVKAVDKVYRELRVLRAAVISSGKVDHAFESIFNVVFFGVVGTMVISFLGFDPLALFLSISGVVLAFAFMISSASAKYFEGLLFILVRRPYTVGDCFHVSGVETDTADQGSPWWLVEDVTLFTTSAMYLSTGERSTMSNGSLANSRIINSSKSDPATLYIMLKFPVSVSYDRLKIFESALEQFVRNRPREWIQLVSFRATRVEADLGFVEYIVVGQHRDTFDEWLLIQTSKADLANFCLELSKLLDIQYKSPHLPVDLMVAAGTSGVPPTASDAMPTHRNMSADSPDLSNLFATFAPQRK